MDADEPEPGVVKIVCDEERYGTAALHVGATIVSALLDYYGSDEEASFLWGGATDGGAVFCTRKGYEVWDPDAWLNERAAAWREELERDASPSP